MSLSLSLEVSGSVSPLSTDDMVSVSFWLLSQPVPPEKEFEELVMLMSLVETIAS